MVPESVRDDFPILSRTVHGKRLVYLDSAATSQKPRRVIDALVRYYTTYNANVHRGIYEMAEEATRRYEESRATLAAFIGARRPAVLVDGAQSAPHMPVNVADLGADFFAFSGHKMCGPTGAGAIWARYEILDAMPPFHGGGEMIMLVQLETSTYKEPPHKFEAGTPNIGDCIVWGEAADYLQGIGMGAIREHEKRLTAYALHALGDVPGLTVFGPRDVEDRGGVVAFTLEGVHPHDVAQVLDQEGIAVRAGHHCTQPLHRRLGVAATTRASMYLYNTESDIDALVRGLHVVRKLFSPRPAPAQR